MEGSASFNTSNETSQRRHVFVCDSQVLVVQATEQQPAGGWIREFAEWTQAAQAPMLICSAEWPGPLILCQGLGWSETLASRLIEFGVAH